MSTHEWLELSVQQCGMVRQRTDLFQSYSPCFCMTMPLLKTLTLLMRYTLSACSGNVLLLRLCQIHFGGSCILCVNILPMPGVPADASGDWRQVEPCKAEKRWCHGVAADGSLVSFGGVAAVVCVLCTAVDKHKVLHCTCPVSYGIKA